VSTTTLVIEILVIGIQAGVGLLLWAIGMLGYGVIHKPLSILDAHGGSWRWSPLVAIVALAACYTLGIFMDRIALFVFHKMIRPFLRLVCPASLKSWAHADVRHALEEETGLMTALYREGGLSHLLQDYRSRLRIARATFANTLLIWSALWFTPHVSAVLPGYVHSVPVATAFGVAFLVIWVIVLGMLQVTYEERLQQAEKVQSRGR